jgi:tetratricopeptide (TPR) repeat protein
MGNLVLSLFIFLQSYTGVEFLRIGVGSRSIAMGDAYIGISDDSYGIFYNPAGIGNIQSLYFSSFYARWFLDTDLASISGVMPLGNKGVIGFGIRGLYTDRIERRTEESPWEYDYYNAYFLNPSFAYAKRLKNFGFGIGINWINAKIEDETGNSLFLNSGIGYYTKFVDFGVSLSNLGTKILNTGLPVNLRMGLCFKPKNDLILSADVVKPFENGLTYNLGLEFSLVDNLTFRFGYNNNFYSDNIFKKLSGGIGFNAGNFIVDYTAASSGIFGLTHFFTISYTFPEKMESIEQKILTKEEMMGETYINQGIRYYNQGKYEEALNSWDLSLIWDPDNKDAINLIAKGKEKLNEKRLEIFFDEAVDEFNQGDYLEAILIIESVLELDSTLKKAKDLKDEAEMRLKKRIPKDIEEKIEQGLSHFMSGNYQSAISIWNEILKLEPDNKIALDYISQAKSKINEEIATTLKNIDDYVSLGNLKIAYDLVSYMLQKYPQNKRFENQKLFIEQKIDDIVYNHLEEGTRFLNSKEYIDAEKEFLKVLEYKPKNSEALVNLKEIKKQISRGKKEEAERLYLLGIDAYTRNNFELAIDYWEMVLDINPSYPNVKKNLERAKIKLSELMK